MVLSENDKLMFNLRQKEKLLIEYQSAIDASALVFKLNSEMKFSYCNESFSKLLGYAKGELKTVSFSLIVDSEYPSSFLMQIYKELFEKKAWHGELALICKDQSKVYLNIALRPIADWQDQIVEILVIGYDITELKNHEKVLNKKIEEQVEYIRQQEEKMLTRERFSAIGEVMGNISHQWKQPLQVIALEVENMRLDAAEYKNIPSDNINDACDVISSKVKLLSNIINDFQCFFSIKDEFVDFNIRDLIVDTANLIQSDFESYGIKLDFACDILCVFACDACELDRSVHGSPNEIKQVLLNILSNAKDVLMQKAIRDPSVKLSWGRNSFLWWVEVRDNGGGIKDELISKIFDPYFTTKHKYQGTGVGLYMSKVFIERHHGGNLTVYNEKDGACFRIEIPIGGEK